MESPSTWTAATASNSVRRIPSSRRDATRPAKVRSLEATAPRWDATYPQRFPQSATRLSTGISTAYGAWGSLAQPTKGRPGKRPPAMGSTGVRPPAGHGRPRTGSGPAGVSGNRLLSAVNSYLRPASERHLGVSRETRSTDYLGRRYTSLLRLPPSPTAGPILLPMCGHGPQRCPHTYPQRYPPARRRTCGL